MQRFPKVGKGPDGRVLYVFSPRERDIIRLVSHGCSNKEIAFQLGITPETAKTYVTELIHALGVDNRVQIARWVLMEPSVLDGMPVELRLHQNCDCLDCAERVA